jgi:hypothetical protein
MTESSAQFISEGIQPIHVVSFLPAVMPVTLFIRKALLRPLIRPGVQYLTVNDHNQGLVVVLDHFQRPHLYDLRCERTPTLWLAVFPHQGHIEFVDYSMFLSPMFCSWQSSAPWIFVDSYQLTSSVASLLAVVRIICMSAHTSASGIA